MTVPPLVYRVSNGGDRDTDPIYVPADDSLEATFTDLVPSALVDSEAHRAALLDLEDAACHHPEHPLGALGSALHVLAARG